MRVKKQIEKLSRKEKLLVESYRTYFPDLNKACEMAKVEIDEFLSLLETNTNFRLTIEKIRLNFFSLAENALVSIIKSKDSTDNNKITASKAILQYKQVLKSF